MEPIRIMVLGDDEGALREVLSRRPEFRVESVVLVEEEPVMLSTTRSMLGLALALAAASSRAVAVHSREDYAVTCRIADPEPEEVRLPPRPKSPRERFEQRRVTSMKARSRR